MKALLAGVLAALLCSVQCGPFTVTISTQTAYRVGENVECEVTITNNDDKDYYLLARHTPLEGLKADIFTVSKRGEVIPYDSIMVKRGPPSEQAYILFKAKSSSLVFVDLSEAYSFDSTGTYTVQLRTDLQFHKGKSINPSTQRVVSNFKECSLTKSLSKPKLTRGALARQNEPILAATFVGADPQPPKFEGNFPPGQEKLTAQAYNLAYAAVGKSIGNVLAKPDMYKLWFGAPYNKIVQTNYRNISSSMGIKRYTLHADPTSPPSCEPDDFAFTYKGMTTIYLCKLYFSAKLTGTNSKMGSIVHDWVMQLLT